MPRIYPGMLVDEEMGGEVGVGDEIPTVTSVASKWQARSLSQGVQTVFSMWKGMEEYDGVEEDAESGEEVEEGRNRCSAADCIQFLIAMVIGSIIYLPFMISVILQSLFTCVPLHPSEWETKMRWQSWLGGFFVAMLMVIGPFVFVFIAYDAVLYMYLINSFIILTTLVQLATLAYASLRPELRSIRVLGREVMFLYGFETCGDEKLPMVSSQKRHIPPSHYLRNDSPTFAPSSFANPSHTPSAFPSAVTTPTAPSPPTLAIQSPHTSPSSTASNQRPEVIVDGPTSFVLSGDGNEDKRVSILSEIKESVRSMVKSGSSKSRQNDTSVIGTSMDMEEGGGEGGVRTPQAEEEEDDDEEVCTPESKGRESESVGSSSQKERESGGGILAVSDDGAGVGMGCGSDEEDERQGENPRSSSHHTSNPNSSLPLPPSPSKGSSKRLKQSLLRRHPLFTCPCWLGLWRNWLAGVLVTMEVGQILSLAATSSPSILSSFKTSVPHTTSSLLLARDTLWSFNLSSPYPSSTPPLLAGIVGCGLTLVYACLCGLVIALDLAPQANLSSVLFSFFAGGLFVMTTSMLLFAILHATDAFLLIPCLIALAYYSSTAVFVSIYRSDKAAVSRHEVRTIPIFLGAERIIKGLLSISLFALPPNIRTPLIAALLLLLTIGLIIYKPMSVPVINTIRTTTTAVATLIAILGAITDHVDSPPEFLVISLAPITLLITFLSFFLLFLHLTLNPILCHHLTSPLYHQPHPNITPILSGSNTPPCFLCASCCLPRGIITPLELKKYQKRKAVTARRRRESAFTEG